MQKSSRFHPIVATDILSPSSSSLSRDFIITLQKKRRRYHCSHWNWMRGKNFHLKRQQHHRRRVNVCEFQVSISLMAMFALELFPHIVIVIVVVVATGSSSSVSSERRNKLKFPPIFSHYDILHTSSKRGNLHVSLSAPAGFKCGENWLVISLFSRMAQSGNMWLLCKFNESNKEHFLLASTIIIFICFRSIKYISPCDPNWLLWNVKIAQEFRIESKEIFTQITHILIILKSKLSLKITELFLTGERQSIDGCATQPSGTQDQHK